MCFTFFIRLWNCSCTSDCKWTVEDPQIWYVSTVTTSLYRKLVLFLIFVYRNMSWPAWEPFSEKDTETKHIWVCVYVLYIFSCIIYKVYCHIIYLFLIKASYIYLYSELQLWKNTITNQTVLCSHIFGMTNE